MVIALHGWLLSSRVWEPFAQIWRESFPDVPLWCPDLPGFGACPRPAALRPNLTSYGDWLAAEVQVRAAGRPLVLMGHSLGASIALHAIASLQRSKSTEMLHGFVMICAGGGIYRPRPFRRLRHFGTLALRLRPTRLSSLRFGGLNQLGFLLAEEDAARGLLTNSTGIRAVRQLPLLVSQLGVPSLWISTEKDKVMEPVYVRHLAAYSHDHDLVQLPDCGHLPMCEVPELLSQCVSCWLSKQLMDLDCCQTSLL